MHPGTIDAARPVWLDRMAERLAPLASADTLSRIGAIRRIREAAGETGQGPVTERVWLALKHHLDGLGLPALRPTPEDVAAGKMTAYLAAPGCPDCAEQGALICPECDGQSRLRSDGCERCHGCGQISCHCVSPFSFRIPDHALSGFIALGIDPAGQARYARLVSPILASRWLPLEAWAWIVLLALIGGVSTPALIATASPILGLLVACATIALVVGLARRRAVARVVGNVVIGAALVGLFGLGWPIPG